MKNNQPASQLPHPDFDGHTDFEKLTPEQKLEWLSAIVILATTSKKLNQELQRSRSEV